MVGTLPVRYPLVFALLACCFCLVTTDSHAEEKKLPVFFYLSGILGNGSTALPPAHPLKTANDYVPPYRLPFQAGLNPGYYGSNWSDNDIYQLCHDAGCRSARNTLPDSFLAQWGSTIRVNTFKHIVEDLDFKGITTFLEKPRDDWRSTEIHGGERSKLWEGLYEPIWDEGQNGTPVNDQNRFALYVWDVVNNYGPYIDIYEIVNEPDYTSSNNGWESPGQPGNWWENTPDPSDLPNLHAPVYQYIRLLRIAYTVVKKYDPQAYVTPGGLGYPSFLDVLLRNTDNPDNGKVSIIFPLRGGAYFDILSIHNYPQYGTRYYENGQWWPDRHSDKAVSVFLSSQVEFADVLNKHGYNGTQYPSKQFVITEMNVARRQIGENLGGIILQRNFTIKAIVKAQQSGIKMIQWFLTGEGKDYNDASAGPYDLMGFYENLRVATPGNQKITDQGRANRTAYQQIYGWTYDSSLTRALGLPPTVDGGAFVKNGFRRYVLWAKTTTDNSETASAWITLPDAYYQQTSWNGSTQEVSGANLRLTGAPVFLTPLVD